MSSADKTTSREWEISQRIRFLLGHMAYGTITESEYAELQDLMPTGRRMDDQRDRDGTSGC